MVLDSISAFLVSVVKALTDAEGLPNGHDKRASRYSQRCNQYSTACGLTMHSRYIGSTLVLKWNVFESEQFTRSRKIGNY